MITCCSCGKPMPDTAFRRSEAHALSGPWAAAYNILSGPCPYCNQAVVAYTFPDKPDVTFSWSVRSQMLTEGKDYKVFRRNAPRQVPGMGKPLVAVYFNTPFKDKSEWTDKILTNLNTGPFGIMSMFADCKVAIFPYNMDWSLALNVSHQFDEIWQLSPEITTDERGPMQSVRAELSLLSTLGTLGLVKILHFWPSACFPPDNYVRLGTDDELLKGWATQVRSTIPVKVN